MKRFLFALVAAATMLFTSCDDEEHIFLETGMWEMTNAPATYEPTTLSFSGRRVSIMNANSHVSPLDDGIWDYYIREKSKELHMSRSYFDNYGKETYESYTYDMKMAADGQTMELRYDPLIGSTRVFKFRRI